MLVFPVGFHFQVYWDADCGGKEGRKEVGARLLLPLVVS